jgi:hypothetical protein
MPYWIDNLFFILATMVWMVTAVDPPNEPQFASINTTTTTDNAGKISNV